MIAAWSFAFATISPGVDVLSKRVHNEIVAPFWITLNRIVDHGYKDLHFTFEPIETPVFEMLNSFDLHQLKGYMRTCSACTKYLAHRGIDPVYLVQDALLDAWGDPTIIKSVQWQLNVMIGRV